MATDDASLSGSKGNWDHMTIWACSPEFAKISLMGVVMRSTVRVGTLQGGEIRPLTGRPILLTRFLAGAHITRAFPKGGRVKSLRAYLD